MFLGILNSSMPPLSIALQFIAVSLHTTERRRQIAQTPPEMLERPTFTTNPSYDAMLA